MKREEIKYEVIVPGTRLTPLVEAGKGAKGQRRVICRCECGVEKEYVWGSIKGGRTRSCGCLHREVSTKRCIKRNKLNTKWKHALKHPSLYRCWESMKSRCLNPKTSNFARYGGRMPPDQPICVHSEWIASFDMFAEYVLSELGERPPGKTPKGRALYSLDRINNDEHYEPGNLRWATTTQQAKNRGNTFRSPWLVREIKSGRVSLKEFLVMAKNWYDIES